MTRLGSAHSRVRAGLGFEAIRHLAKDSQNTLYLCSRNEASGQEAVKKIKSEHSNANVTLVVLVVTKDDSIAAASELTNYATRRS